MKKHFSKIKLRGRGLRLYFVQNNYIKLVFWGGNVLFLSYRFWDLADWFH
jgi:hypothetical protein